MRSRTLAEVPLTDPDAISAAVLRSWDWSPATIAALLTAAVVYCRGWRQLQHVGDRPPTRGQLAAFMAGLFTVYIALASPLDAFSYFLLSVHMVQHDLLLFVAPPLIWLAQPELPLLLGLPAPVRRYWLGPVVRHRTVRRFFTWLAHPKTAFVVFVLVLWGWHMPPLYDLTLRSPLVHDLEHAFFFYAGLLFWWPVVSPYPARPAWSRWALLPFLFFAGIQGAALSFWLIVSNHVLYPHYLQMPRIAGLAPLEDQSWAGMLMLVPGSLIGVAAALLVTAQLLHPPRIPAAAERRAIDARTTEPPAAAGAADLLNVPGIGRLLRWRHARLALQAPMLAFATFIALDGLRGPPLAAMNLAGVVPWIAWRGFLIVSLLLLGNVFCLACPFMLPRKAGKLLAAPRRPWPRSLRNKWLVAGLVVVFFWAYETVGLWDSPRATAWIILGYFAAALGIDVLFRGAAFCKYVCPVGQFNFVNSLFSPTEIRIKSRNLCRACTTHDCIRGRGSIPGCELDLYAPRKGSNLDCTYCLDCVHACPYDNIGLLAVTPGRELVRDYSRSSIRRIHARPDLAALILVLTFGAFVNAAGMVAPVLRAREYLTANWGLTPHAAATVFIAAALLVVPLALTFLAAGMARLLGATRHSLTTLAARFAYALLPLGVGMWLAHYSFHLFTSAGAIVPVVQRFAADHGINALGVPIWSHGGMLMMSGPRLLRFQLLCLDVGLLASLYVAWRLARDQTASEGPALRLFAPWAGLIGLLFWTGIWLLFQPMEMRGTMAMGG
jgi:cytochrome c oxidase assembly factor CtaG/polyferredoxin